MKLARGGSRGRAPDPTSLRFEGHSNATMNGGLARRSFSEGGREMTDRTPNGLAQEFPPDKLKQRINKRRYARCLGKD